MRRQYWADFLPDHMLPGTAELACHLLLGHNDNDGSAVAESCSKSLKKLVAIAQPKTANCLPLLVGVTIK